MKYFLSDGAMILFVCGMGITLILGIALHNLWYILVICLFIFLCLFISMLIYINKKMSIQQKLRNGISVVGKLVPESVRTKWIGRNSMEVLAQICFFDEKNGKTEMFTGKTVISGIMLLEKVEQIKKIKDVKIVYLEDNHKVYHVFLTEEVDKI